MLFFDSIYTMDLAENPAACSQEHSDSQALVTSETIQVTADIKPVESLASNIDIITMNGKPVLKLAGNGMTEFHKFTDLPLQLRTKILEVNMFQDPLVSEPRIIRIHMECTSPAWPNHFLLALLTLNF